MINSEKKIEKENWTNFEIEFYKECGHLYRHFSSIRTIVMTAGFGSFVTACAYILVNTDDRESMILWSIAALVFYFVIMIVSAIFTIKANQAKMYMTKIEIESYKMANFKVEGPFRAIVLKFDPMKNSFDAVTGIFLLIPILPAIAFVYRIFTLGAH